jgi:vacuolar-type H+-ATPase subunit F/Vma7
MAELVVIGDNEFVMGFELIGLNSFDGDTKEKLKALYMDAINNKEVGIIVTNDRSIEKIEPSFRRLMENSVSPVVVVVSASSAGQENLRDMIKKAIGIDLWSK